MTPRTIVIAGNGTSVLDYNLPPGVYQYVQAVLANIDNTAGAAIRPTLRVKEQTGTVIATTRPAESIPAGGSGSATWALRLSDSSAVTGTSGIFFDTAPQDGDYLYTKTTRPTSPGGYGTEFLVEGLEAGVGFHLFVNSLSNGGMILIENGDDGGTIINDYGAGGMIVEAPSGIMTALGQEVEIHATTGAGRGVVVFLDNTNTGGNNFGFTVKNHLGNPIFRVDEDGDLHGLAGKALVFDL